MDSPTRPVIHPGNEWIFDAYMTLDSCRQIGMGLGPIPWLAFDDYARRKELDGETAEILWGVIHRADTLHRAEQAKRNRN